MKSTTESKNTSGRKKTTGRKKTDEGKNSKQERHEVSVVKVKSRQRPSYQRPSISFDEWEQPDNASSYGAQALARSDKEGLKKFLVEAAFFLMLFALFWIASKLEDDLP